MADIELVVKISEKTINEIKDNAMFAGDMPSDIRWNVTSAIVNGIPLPKGHGRLIDADKFLKDNEAYTGFILDSRFFGGKNAYKDALEDLVNEASTIIEADK